MERKKFLPISLQGKRMFSSKGADNPPRNKTPRRGSATRKLLSALALVVILVALGTAYYIQFGRGTPTGQVKKVPQQDKEASEWLDEARQHLALVPTVPTPESREQHAHDAQRLLDQCLEKAPKQQTDTVLALLAASQLALQEDALALDRDFDLSQIEAADLRLVAHIAFGSGSFALADRFITEALTRREDRADVLRVAILIRFELGRDEEVLEHVDELRELAPEDPRPLEVKGRVWENRGGHWDSAIAAYEEYLKIQPDGVPQIRLRLASLLITQGDKKEARAQLMRIGKEAPQLVEENPILAARLLHLEGQTEKALLVAEHQLKSNPEDAAALLLRSQIVLGQGKFAEAVKGLQETIKADPVNTEAHYLLGQALARNGQTDEAKQQMTRHQHLLESKKELYRLERKAGHNPQDVEVRNELARQYEKLGLEELAEFWRQAASAVPGTPR